MLSRRRLLQAAPSGLILSSVLGSAVGTAMLPRRARAFSIPVSGVERLTRMLVETPRAELMPLLVTKINQGIFPRSLLASLTMAAVHHVEPYPDVGFKYHAVMMLSSVHNTLRHLDESEQWLGMLWAADTFKQAQQRDTFNGDWQLADAIDANSNDPLGDFIRAMDSWDGEGADIAISQLAGEMDLDELFALLFYYGARDFRDIGHKTITVSNSYRLLRLFGDAYAQPVLRSTVYALLNHEGESNPSTSDHPADKPWRANLHFATLFPLSWEEGKPDPSLVPEVLTALRSARADETGSLVVDMLQQSVAPQTLWDGIMLSAGELLIRVSGITSVHANTSINAMHYGYKRADDDQTKRMLLLQAMSFVTLFRDLLGDRRKGMMIDNMEPLETLPLENEQDTFAELFASISTDRRVASRQLLHILQQGGEANRYRALGRLYTMQQNAGYHDYKFTEAAFENSYAISPEWRHRYLAASVYYMNGSGDKLNTVVSEARELLQA
ncbi:hypothetical protein [Aliamphritea hakodatensis]|uniref:hypothetical protein n=1 Tax=Aliamphritea hakodatensis TaxID=2895352 RepID=UPI0022FDA7D6|nr:hypothetical protein [Aliamphritea hakodatensis]